MVAFIKRRKDFRTVASAEVVSYDVPLASMQISAERDDEQERKFPLLFCIYGIV